MRMYPRLDRLRSQVKTMYFDVRNQMLSHIRCVTANHILAFKNIRVDQ